MQLGEVGFAAVVDAALDRTLYTAVYWPCRDHAELQWPGHAVWGHTFDAFHPGAVEVVLPDKTLHYTG